MNPKRKKLSVEVICIDAAIVGKPTKPSGWGEGATAVKVAGTVAKVAVTYGDDTQFSIRIDEKGNLTLTGYAGVYEMDVPRQLQLTNTRPWE